jgi:tetratricopeptide (TPR) repeat protein
MPLLRLLLALLLVSGPLLADAAGDVRMHFKKGQTHYALGEFQEAIEEFREAYRLRQEPAILFNLAQSYRQIREWQHAYFHYRQYLNQNPDASNRAEVESLIEQMKTKIDEDERVAKAQPAPVVVEPVQPPAQVVAAPEPVRIARPPSEPQKPAFVAPTPGPPAVPPPKGHGLRYAGYVALGAGAIAGGVAFVLHGSAQSAADQFNGKYQAGTLTAADSRLRDEASSKGKLATEALIAGAVLIAGGAVLTFAF